MNRKHSNPVVSVLSIFVALFLLVMGAWNIPLLQIPLQNLLHGRIDFSELITEVQAQYQDHFSAKNGFINLNGWFAGEIRQNVCNGVVKLKNGMLTEPVQTRRDVSKNALNLVSFKEYLEKLGIRFLYVQAPYKCDLNKQLLPEGIESYSNDHAESLIAILKSHGTSVLDLRPEIAATPELVEEYFLRTDHHWNYAGAFLGFQRLAEKLREIFPEKDLDISHADPTQWNSFELKNWSLGSHGKRVGIYYGGVDDFVYYVPKFDTNMSCTIPNHSWVFKGDFADSNIRSHFLEDRDYFEDATYFLYIGGSYPIVRHRNAAAPNHLRILMLIDSFARPVQTYLSTMFDEIDVIDPRYFTQTNVAKYAQYFQPDIVIELIHPNLIIGTFSDFGVADAQLMDFNARRPVFDSTDIEINENTVYAIRSVPLEPGQSYLLQFDDIEFTSGTSHGCALELFDSDASHVLSEATFDIEYSRTHDDFLWFFTVPDDAGENFELRFRAGLPENAKNNAAVYRGVRLEAVD